jgi:transposase
MMIIGIDAHKRSHTAVTVDEMGRQGFVKTVGTTTQDHLRLLKWAVGLAEERLWAIEDCRHLTRRLERDLIAAGESVVRVSPKLMAHVRDSARSYGKSDPIDALAVARAALPKRSQNERPPADAGGRLACSEPLSLVAGTGFEPATSGL